MRRRRCVTWSARVTQCGWIRCAAVTGSRSCCCATGSASTTVQAWTQRHRQWLATVTLPWPAAQATMLDARGAIDALCHRRERLKREIIAMLPSSPWVPAGRPAAMPARGRHADRGRVVRGDRRLRAVRPCRAVDELRRPGALGVDDRATASARVDHEDRLRARAAAAGRGRVALPVTPEHRPRAHQPPGQPAAGSDRGRLVSPAATTPHLDTAGGPRETPHDHRRRRRSRARRLSPGRSPKSSNHKLPHIAYPVGWVGGGPATRGEPAS